LSGDARVFHVARAEHPLSEEFGIEFVHGLDTKRRDGMSIVSEIQDVTLRATPGNLRRDIQKDGEADDLSGWQSHRLDDGHTLLFRHESVDRRK
jgi:hypothetical protein